MRRVRQLQGVGIAFLVLAVMFFLTDQGLLATVLLAVGVVFVVQARPERPGSDRPRSGDGDDRVAD